MSTTTTSPPTIKPSSNHPGRKHRKVAEEDIKSMATIHQSWDALEALYRYRAMKPIHLAKLLFLGRPDPNGKIRDMKSAHEAANRRCLYHLHNRKYVKLIYPGYPVRNGELEEVKTVEMYTLTKEGFDALQDHRQSLGLEIHPKFERAFPVINENFLHSYGIMEAGIACEAAVRRSGGAVTTYWDDYEIRRRSKLTRGALQWGGLEPDALIIAKINGIEHAFLLENDTGSQSVASPAKNSIRTKAQRYKDFFIHYRPADPLLGPLRQPTVHFITKSEDRMNSIRTEIEDQGGRHAYWYSTVEWTTPPDYSFLGEVWQVSGRVGYHSPITHFKQ